MGREGEVMCDRVTEWEVCSTNDSQINMPYNLTDK